MLLSKSKRSCLAHIFSRFGNEKTKFDRLTFTIRDSLGLIQTTSSDPNLIYGSLFPKTVLHTDNGEYPKGTCKDINLTLGASYSSPFLQELLPKIQPHLSTSDVKIEIVSQKADILLDFKPAFLLENYPTIRHTYTHDDKDCQSVYQNCMDAMLLNHQACEKKKCLPSKKLKTSDMYNYIAPNILKESLYFPIFWLNINSLKIRETTLSPHIPK